MSSPSFAQKRMILANASVPHAVFDDPLSGDLGLYDIVIADGRIAEMVPAGTASRADAEVTDCDHGLVLPGFIDMHTHLDKGHIWPRKANPDGTWMGALLAVGADREKNWAANDVARRMDFALRSAYAHGTVGIRTHLDSAPPQHEISFATFEAVQAEWAGRIELQAVALMGPNVLLDKPTLKQVAARAKAAGGVLGGSVAADPEARAAMFNAVEMAGEMGLDLDLHSDESGDPEAMSLRHLADAVIETGFKGNVVAGHCCSLAIQSPEFAQKTIERVVEADIAVVSLPMCNLYLQDRGANNARITPHWRGVTLLRELKAAGARVAIASDNTRDPFYAYGDLDGLEVLREGARILQFDHPLDEAHIWMRSVGADPAAICGFDHTATLSVGGPADMVVFRARSWTELMARPQADRVVIRGGNRIDTNLPDYRELDDLMGAL